MFNIFPIYPSALYNIIDEKGLLSKLLFFKYIPSPHTSANIRKLFDDSVESFNIRFYCIVTDNAANMKKAFSASLIPQQVKTIRLFEDSDDNESESENEDEDVTHELNSEDIFENSLRCAAHTMQLVVHDGLEAINNERVSSSLTKVRNIARLAAKSTAFAQLLQGRLPPQSNVTRWSSEYRLIQHILLNLDDISRALLTESKKSLILSHLEIDILKQISERLSFFAEATDLLQAELKPTISVVIPVLISLERALRSFSTKSEATAFPSETGNQLCDALLQSLQTRFNFVRTDPIYIAGAILDPSLKLSFAMSNEAIDMFFFFQRDECKAAALHLLQRLSPRDRSDLCLESASRGESSIQRNSSDDNSSTCPKRRLLDFLSESNNPITQTPASLSTAFDDYLSTPLQSVPNAVLYWLNSNSILRTAALEILSVPASSAPVERIFSRAGRFMSPLRSRLSHSRFSDLMCLTVNTDN